jgi:phosphoesterase RecJ-like protein
LANDNSKNQIEEIVEVLKSEDSFLLTAHLKPEGDSIGSQLALELTLHEMGKAAIVVNDDPVPDMLGFLPHSEKIMGPDAVDVIPPVSIVLDCGGWDRLGKSGELARQADTVLNIDHHPDTDGLGKYNYIDPVASASGEQVYEIAQRLGIMNYNIAVCVYVAIVSDTGGFRYSNTSSDTHRITSDLLKHGVKCNEVAYKLYESDPPSLVRAMGLALAGIQVKNGVAWARLTRDDLEKAGVLGGALETEKIIRQIRTLSDIRVVVFLTEMGDGEVKVNLRARPGFDVGSLAKDFGGGGHRQASGCTVEGTMPDVEKKVIGEIFNRMGR